VYKYSAPIFSIAKENTLHGPHNSRGKLRVTRLAGEVVHHVALAIVPEWRIRKQYRC
jgi:hypothetical protein